MAISKLWHRLDRSMNMEGVEDERPWPNHNFSKCQSDAMRPGDMPPDFRANSTHMCGISYPQATPFKNMTHCCREPVIVYNDCFHYCQTDLDSGFGLCVGEKFDFSPLMSVCNFTPDDNKCDPNSFKEPQGVPFEFNSNSAHMCGINYPQATPLHNITRCCEGEVVVYHNCFHYCQTDLNLSGFSDCIADQFEAQMTVCNGNTDDGDPYDKPAASRSAWQPFEISMVVIGIMMLFILFGMAIWRRRQRSIRI